VASVTLRLSDNAQGPLFVDTSCIDCETCRIVAPEIFGDASDHAFVVRQPQSPEEHHRALMALVACPTSSIGTEDKQSVSTASRAFPESIVEDVYYCGYASESSFGASSYLIQRKDGNVLVDSPRAARPLLERIEALGGVRFLFLTHRDDVADHAIFRRRFGCDRVMLAADADAAPGCERVIEGDGPCALADDLTIVPVPGHTEGSAVLVYKDTLFSGDHVWGTPDGRLSASRKVCWFSWREQTRSMRKLRGLAVRRVLPGHGRRFEAESPARLASALEDLISRMEKRG
jgi:glyoxylase-like metal-dependent hydrolase (beta-lactamase superfamily II)/ferredoxin